MNGHSTDASLEGAVHTEGQLHWEHIDIAIILLEFKCGTEMGIPIALNNQAPLSYSWRDTRVLLTNNSRGDLNLKTWFCIQKQSHGFLTPVSQPREGSLDSAFVSMGYKLPFTCAWHIHFLMVVEVVSNSLKKSVMRSSWIHPRVFQPPNGFVSIQCLITSCIDSRSCILLSATEL